MKLVYRLSFIVYRLIFILFITSFFLLTTNYELRKVYANESSPSSEIRVKLKILEEEIASKAAFFKQEVKNKLQNRAYIGVVLSKTDTTLTIQTDNGLRTVNIKSFTEYVGKPSDPAKISAKLTLATLQSQDYVAALGDLDENQVLSTKRLVKLTTLLKSDRQVLVGTITSVGKSSLSIQTTQNQAVKITTTKNTDYFHTKEALYRSGTGKIASGSAILIITQTGKDNSLIARVIYLLKEVPKGV